MNEECEVTLSLPKSVYLFYVGLTTFLKEDLATYLSKIIINELGLYLDEFPKDILIEKYHLEEYAPKEA